jgi:hypothetical protein
MSRRDTLFVDVSVFPFFFLLLFYLAVLFGGKQHIERFFTQKNQKHFSTLNKCKHSRKGFDKLFGEGVCGEGWGRGGGGWECEKHP